MSIITAIVARHPETDKNVHPQTMEAIEAQFDTAKKQVGTDAIKIGMIFTAEDIERVAELIERSEVKYVVVDPVMVGKLDSKLLRDDEIYMLIERLLPLATVITPNMPEASILLGGRELTSVEDLKQAAIDLYEKTGQKALVKGGRLSGPAVDVLYDGETLTSFEAPKIGRSSCRVRVKI